MTPGILNLAFTQGDDYNLTLSFVDGNDDDSPVDYSGFVFTSQIRELPESPDAVDFAIDDSDSDDGVIRLSLTAAQTRTLPEACGWDLQMEGSDIITLLAGTVAVERDYTRESV